jgi:hypothetical protein
MANASEIYVYLALVSTPANAQRSLNAKFPKRIHIPDDAQPQQDQEFVAV